MANALALYTAPEGGLREDVQTYADDQMLPYLNQRPSLAEQSANYWLPQFAALLGPGPRETLDKGWTPPNAEQVFADPLMNMLQPGNIGMAGMLVGKGSKLWKSAPQVGESVIERATHYPFKTGESFTAKVYRGEVPTNEGSGMFYADNPIAAQDYPDHYGGPSSIVPAHIHMENPYVLESKNKAIKELFPDVSEYSSVKKKYDQLNSDISDIYNEMRDYPDYKDQYLFELKPLQKKMDSLSDKLQKLEDSRNLYIKFKNKQHVWNFTEDSDFLDLVKERGHDGIIFKDVSPYGRPHRTFMPFEDTSIENALTNPPETYPQGAFSNLYDKKPMLEVSDEGLRFNPAIEQNNLSVINAITDFHLGFGRKPKLGDILEHEELYKAYPELKDINLEAGKITSGASFNPSTNTITIGREFGLKPDDKVAKDLLHEIQHAIQEREGWARGGSPGGMEQEYSNAMARLKFLEKEPDYIEGSKEMDKVWDAAFNKGTIGDDEAMLLEAQIEAKYPSLKESRVIAKKLRDFNGEYDQYNNQRLGITTGSDAYKRLFGEYMARDTASRNALTEAQRMRTMPFSSEPEMTPDKMIYRYGGNALQAHTAYHGSPHKWTKVDLSKAGTGEGAAAYGHGFYATDMEDVAKYYRDRLSAPDETAIGRMLSEQDPNLYKKILDEVNLSFSNEGKAHIKANATQVGRSVLQAGDELFGLLKGDLSKEARAFYDKVNTKGHLYKLDIPGHENLLDWDKPLSEQPEKVREALNRDPYIRSFMDAKPSEEIDITGRGLYDSLSKDLLGIGENQTTNYSEARRKASEHLRSIGIPGHKYLDQGSRGAGEGTYNYVIYDPEAVNVLEMSRNNPELFRSNVA